MKTTASAERGGARGWRRRAVTAARKGDRFLDRSLTTSRTAAPKVPAWTNP